MGAPIINAAEFAAFVLVFFRVSIMVAIAPILGNANIPAQVKAILMLMLTFTIAPMVKFDASMMPMTWFGFVFLGLGEILLGFSLAFMVRLILEAAKVAGEYISFQMSLSMLNSMDPQSGGQTPLMALLLNIIMTLIFLYANGHYLILKAMADSFRVAPPGLLSIWRPEMFNEVMLAMVGMYILAVKMAAPVVAVLFCIKASFGIVAKAVPQMNVLFVGMPVYIIVGFLVMGFGMPWWPVLLEKAMLASDQALSRVLNVFAPF